MKNTDLGLVTVLTLLVMMLISPIILANPEPELFIPSVPDIHAKNYILMDANSGHIIAQKNADEPIPPASLTKMMTLYIASKMLASQQIHLTDQVTISQKAWKTKGSRMFVQVGSRVSVKDLIQGIIVQSGNDACTALAEHIGGTESAFVAFMNQTAKRLGMTHSSFMDSTGLPNPKHHASAHDLAILARALINDFPQYYPWYQQKWFTYNKIKQPNRNRLLWSDPSVDGIKTGHTEASGYCLVASAKRGGMRLISVVMGADTESMRNSQSQALLNFGFRFFESHRLIQAQQTVSEPRSWFAQVPKTPVGLAKDLYITVPKGSYPQVQCRLVLNPLIQAPIALNQPMGTVDVTLNNTSIAQAPLVALISNPQGGLFHRLYDHVLMLFHHG